MPSRKSRGDQAEDLACNYLKKQNMKILKRNFRGKRGELDIVGRTGKCLCVVEVRSRSAGSPYVPEESLTRAKLARLGKTTRQLVSKYNLTGLPVRLDLLVIDWQTGDPDIRFYPGTITETFPR
ncbi:MAG: YraN family protein [bacterium]